MEYRDLGKSGMKVSTIAFGAWAVGGTMWGGSDDNDAITAIQHSLDLGITTIDTAPAYGNGASERIVGKAIKGRRDQVQILTKFGLQINTGVGTLHLQLTDLDGQPLRLYKNAKKDIIIAECEQSLKNLNTDYIDVYQQHWPDPATPLDETFEAVEQLLKAGKIRAIGVSNYSCDQLDVAGKMASITSIQPPYSMVNRGIEKELLPYCITNDIGVVVYSPLQRGLLTGKIGMDTQFPATDHRSQFPSFKPENRQKVLGLLDRIKPIAESHRITLAQLAIAWTIAQKGISTALVGARNPQQAKENARAAAVKLTSSELEWIDAHSKKIILQ